MVKLEYLRHGTNKGVIGTFHDESDFARPLLNAIDVEAEHFKSLKSITVSKMMAEKAIQKLTVEIVSRIQFIQNQSKDSRILLEPWKLSFEGYEVMIDLAYREHFIILYIMMFTTYFYAVSAGKAQLSFSWQEAKKDYS